MKISSEQAMLDFGKNFAQKLASPRNFAAVIELVGDVGAGKTTFTRGLAQGLGITKPVTSPSFTISKSYALPTGGQLIHYDFYRLPDPGLMLDDLRDALTHPNNIIIIEWSNSIKHILPPDHIQLHISKLDDGSRDLQLKNTHGATSHGHTQPSVSKPSKASSTTPSHNKQSANTPTQLSLYLDTSTPTTILRLNDTEYSHHFANDLAEGLLAYLHDKLADQGSTFHDITDITFMSGPGSFTGLRIGTTVVNTLAHELHIPLYDHHGQSHRIIVPDYGRPANISTPRK